MAVRAHRELIPRSAFGIHTHQPGSDPTMLEQLSKNITRQGITNSTLNYLRVSGDTLSTELFVYRLALLTYFFLTCLL